MTIKELKKIKTYDDLEASKIGQVYADISHRGGGIGFYAADVARAFDVQSNDLPGKFGAGCNYLGGGIRGAIFPSTFSSRITGKKAALLEALAAACVRVYKDVENENSLNDEEDPDGDINWDAKATNGIRKAGVQAAY